MPNKGEPITTKFSVDISELKAGIQEANRQIKLANSEFKAAASGMDDWSKSADGLSAKIQQLSSVQDAENKKLELLKEQYKLVAAEQGENSVAAQNLQIKINNQQAAVNKVTLELNKYSQQLGDLRNAQGESSQAADDQRSAYEKLQDTISDQGKALADLKTQYAAVALEQGDNSDAAQTLGRKISDLSNELSDNKSKLKEAESAADSFDTTLDDLGDSAEDSEGGFTILGGAIATFAGNVLTAAAGKITDFTGSLFEMSEATEEYRQMLAKVEGSANSFGYSIDFAREKYQDFYKYVGDDQMATNAITNLMGMKVSTETVSDAANAAIAVWSAYGDSIPIEGLTESINETAQVAQVTGSLADALNWAGISEDEFNGKLGALTTTQERADLIAQTLNDTYGSSKKTFDELSAGALAANEAELALKDTQSELGAAVEPVNTAITNLKAQALDAISPATQTVAGHVSNLLNWLLETPGAAQGAAAMIAGLATSFTILAGAMAIQALINGVQKAFALLNVTMIANPFVLIATLIAGLVAAFVTLWTTSEGFRNFWVGLWETISSAASTALNGIITFFTETIPAAFNSFTTFLQTNWQGLLLLLVNPFAGAFKLLYDNFEGFRTFVDEFVASVKAKFSEWVNALVTFFTVDIPAGIDSMITFFGQIPEKIAYWLAFALGRVLAWGQQLIEWAQEAIPEFIDTMIEFISELPGKFWTWLTTTLNNVIAWGVSLVATGRQKATEFINGVIEFVQTLPARVKEWTDNTLNNIIAWGVNMVNTGRQKANEFINGVIQFIKTLPSKAKTWLDETISNVIQWGSDMIAKAKEAASETVNTVVTTLQELPGKVIDIGKDVVRGIWDGITSMGSWLYNKVSDFVDSIIDGFTDGMEIESPSKVMKRLAKYIPEGVGEGITENAKLAIQPVKNLTGKIREAASGMGGVKSSLSGQVAGIRQRVAGVAAAAAEQAQAVKNLVFNQYNTSPKALSRLEIYRQSKNLLRGAAVNV